jgi:hypothetical protein
MYLCMNWVVARQTYIFLLIVAVRFLGLTGIPQIPQSYAMNTATCSRKFLLVDQYSSLN